MRSISPRKNSPATCVPIPVLLYHSVSDDPPGWIEPFAVGARSFARHLDVVLEMGCTPLTISGMWGALEAGRPLPKRAIAITFDDGLADFADAALPAMTAREIVSTLYLTTGGISSLGDGHTRLPPAPMLDVSQLADIERAGVELGSHSQTHPQLDLLAIEEAGLEIRRSKDLLEHALGHEVATFSYPHGFFTRRVRRAVQEAGYRTACAVRNAISSAEDDPFAISRLTIRSSTSVDDLKAWLSGRGARVAPFPERIRTKAFRNWRRATQIVAGASV